jgi:hypothetical protein
MHADVAPVLQHNGWLGQAADPRWGTLSLVSGLLGFANQLKATSWIKETEHGTWIKGGEWLWNQLTS